MSNIIYKLNETAFSQLLQTVKILDSSKCLRRRWSKEAKKQRTELRAERLSSRRCSIYKTVISLNSFVGTTNDFLAALQTLEMSSDYKLNNLFKTTEFSSKDSSFSLPLTISSINYSEGCLEPSLKNAIRSDSLECTASNVQPSVEIQDQRSLEILDAKGTTQSILNLRHRQNFPNGNRESYVVDKKNSSRSSKLLTSDLSLLLPTLNDYLTNKSSFFLNETTVIKTSNRTSTYTNKSLNEKINSALFNLVALNHINNERSEEAQASYVQRRISIRSIRHNFVDCYSQNSAYIDYFDPIQGNMDQYVDLTSKSLVKNSNTTQIGSTTAISKFSKSEEMKTCRTVSIYSLNSSSRPVSIIVKSC